MGTGGGAGSRILPRRRDFKGLDPISFQQGRRMLLKSQGWVLEGLVGAVVASALVAVALAHIWLVLLMIRRIRG